MFTGIIQCQGEVLAYRQGGGERRFRIRPHESFNKLIDGESIAVNGVCLSVENHDGQCFVAYASGETLAHTTLGTLNAGTQVNLERALALGDRVGGHLVSGHVDCVAVVASNVQRGESRCLRLEFPAAFGREVIPKGSVALDGISLTVNSCGEDFLEVNIIPDTQRRTNMRTWRPGSRVNMETDLVGKYVARLLAPWQVAGISCPSSNSHQPQPGGLSLETLRKSGFLQA